MKILAIETSCDDTGIAILEAENEKFTVLSNIVSSQAIHQNYGGVFPMMAKREHQKNIVPVLQKALTEANLLKEEATTLTQEQIQTLQQIFEKEEELFDLAVTFFQTYAKPEIDAIAVTYGPGLEPCLWVGVNFVRVLSYIWGIEIIPVNHIEAHILVNFLTQPEIAFPALSLIVSGGHTQLVLVKNVGEYEIIGETRDDAAGECFDKCAKLLGLGYPGGPIISKIAAEAKESNIVLPRPMLHSKDYDFSFSGLKTAVLYETKGKEITENYVKNMSVAVQDAIVDVLLQKTLHAAKEYNVKTIILGGGVSANHELRKQFQEKSEIPAIFPEPKLSTDNGVMIAVAGYFNMKNPPSRKASARQRKIGWQNLQAEANLRIGY